MKKNVAVNLIIVCLLVVSGTTQAVLVTFSSDPNLPEEAITVFSDNFETASDPTPYSYHDPLNTTDSDPDSPSAGTWVVDEYDQRGIQVTSWLEAAEGDYFASVSRLPSNAFMAAEFAPQSAGLLHAELMVYVPTLQDDGNGNADDYAIGIALGNVNDTGNDLENYGLYVYTKTIASAQLQYKHPDGNWYTLYNAGGSVLNYTPDQWCKWTIDYNLEAGTWVLDIDGVSTLPRTETYSGSISCLSFRAGANRGTAYVDAVAGPPDRYCGDSGTVFLQTDVGGPEGTRDCYVNMHDLTVFAGDWLKCNDPADPCNCE